MHETFYFPSFYVNVVLTGWHTSPQPTFAHKCMRSFIFLSGTLSDWIFHSHTGREKKREHIRTMEKKMRCDFDKSKKIRFECVYLYSIRSAHTNAIIQQVCTSVCNNLVTYLSNAMFSSSLEPSVSKKDQKFHNIGSDFSYVGLFSVRLPLHNISFWIFLSLGNPQKSIDDLL